VIEIQATLGAGMPLAYAPMVQEARLEPNESGLEPVEDGWFVVNVRDVAWFTSDAFGSACRFESAQASFGELGVNLRVLEPGQPNCLYHGESNQEAFLVLHGEALLLVDGEERPLRQWDFAHLPPMTEHVAVGAGDGPCVILMVGARSEDEKLHYPVSELAARYGASAEQETDSPDEAYARFARPRQGRPASWERLPWA
jgi:uncharacterized cupin superfamily protein